MNSIAMQTEGLWLVFLSLPIITQWAVTVLLVSGLIVHLAYNERIVHDGPSIFTTSGIFFTFLGIAEGLYGFDPQKIDASIPALLDGLKTAFIASVVGVGAALSIKLRYALFGVRRKAQATRTAGATIDDLFAQMVAVQQALVGNDDLRQLKRTLLDSRELRSARLRSAYSQRCEFAVPRFQKAVPCSVLATSGVDQQLR